MTTERDPNLLIAAWLEEGPRDLPPDTRRAIETAVRTMPQRRLGLGRSWRFPPLNVSLRPILLVAAILISVVGLAVYGRLRPTAPASGTQASPTSSVESPSASVSVTPLTGRIAFTRYNSNVGPFGDYLGTFVADADGTHEMRIDLPKPSDGVAWSPDGTKLLLGNSPPDDKLGFRPAIVNADGTGYRRIEVPGTFQDMFCSAWTPDGQRLLCAIADANDPSVAGIVTIDVATGTDMRRLSSGAYPGVVGKTSECGGGDSPGTFSPDGALFVFVRHRCGLPPDPVADEIAGIYVGYTHSLGDPVRILSMGDVNSGLPQISWSPDGQWLLFTGSDGALYKVHPDGSGKAQIPIDIDGGVIYSAAWSPDGSRVMFSDWPGHTIGAAELYSAATDGSDIRRITEQTGSEESVSWTR